MDVTELYEKAPYNPDDPNPWLALYLDASLPLSDEVKAALLANSGSKSRQFVLPFLRPLAKLSIVLLQIVKLVVPNKLTSSKICHWLIYKGLQAFVRPDANYLILRHFHIGSEVLGFVATNVPGVSIPLNPLRPRTLADLQDDIFLKHDLNIYNFLIRLNREMKERRLKLTKQAHPNFNCITDGPFAIDEAGLPNTWHNFLDLESAIEIYTPVYQLFLTDSDFWRACNSLQLDETVAIYASKLLGDSSYVGLVNNKHPLVPLSTLQAGYRLLLHGLAAESLHAQLVQIKRAQVATAEPVLA
ncbi:hypothetical protein SAMN05421819_0007 [Bryocella elongata]|uniref:Uncharacterized protein n=1 Tax=Bryocella elongata TaxID=863522 RepID=A0A1H5RYT6_9BACT|nr:hypothetical protein [Bryocella elongata]SEF43512.1 hypothetical protein SAMN05421819_0007 [Bryocella elongata]